MSALSSTTRHQAAVEAKGETNRREGAAPDSRGRTWSLGFWTKLPVLISSNVVSGPGPVCCACPKSNSTMIQSTRLHRSDGRGLHRSDGRGLHAYSSAKSLEAFQAVPLVSHSDFPTLQNQKESGFSKLSTSQKVPD